MPISQATKTLIQLLKTKLSPSQNILDFSSFLFAKILLSLSSAFVMASLLQNIHTLGQGLGHYLYKSRSLYICNSKCIVFINSVVKEAFLPSHMFCKTDLTLIITPSGDCICLVCETVVRGRGEGRVPHSITSVFCPTL